MSIPKNSTRLSKTHSRTPREVKRGGGEPARTCGQGGASVSDFSSEVSGGSSREFQAWCVFPEGVGQMAVSRSLGSRAFPDFMAHFP